jgi:hypothetical protein
MLILSGFLITGCGSNGQTGHWLPARQLTSIQVTPATASVPVTGNQQFTAIATYSDGLSIDVTASSTWKSGTPANASVNPASGFATGLIGGTSAVITATYEGLSGSATLNVNAATSVSFMVIPALASIPVTGTQQYTAIETFSDGSTYNRTALSSWAAVDLVPISTTPVATIGLHTGIATGVNPGTSTIRATYTGVDLVTKTATAILTVNKATSKSFTVTPATASVPVTGTQQYTAIETFSDGSTFDRTVASSWTAPDLLPVSTTPVATIGLHTGLAIGANPGTSTITATYTGVDSVTKTATAILTVTAATSKSFAVIPATASIVVTGGTQQFTAIETFSDGSTQDRTLDPSTTWTAVDLSGGPGVATIVPTGVGAGVATGHAMGTSTITATYTPVVGPALVATAILTVTAPNPGLAGPAPDLKTASTYGLIASSAMTISAIPQTHIYGDVALINNDAFTGFAFGGTIPLPTSSYVTPRTSPGINGPSRGSAADAAQAQIDLAAAYANLWGRSPTTNYAAGATQLSGLVLTPGIYRAGTPVAADTFALDNSSGPLVLDAQGNSDAVFIFQANDITTTTGSVILQNGAQPKNVFWVMAATATIGNGSSSIFQGTVVAGLDITVNGANVQGRMLAGASGTGALTISAGGSFITVPAP